MIANAFPSPVFTSLRWALVSMCVLIDNHSMAEGNVFSDSSYQFWHTGQAPRSLRLRVWTMITIMESSTHRVLIYKLLFKILLIHIDMLSHYLFTGNLNISHSGLSSELITELE